MWSVPDHPDIRSAEKTGYTLKEWEEMENCGYDKPIDSLGKCLGCNELVYTDEERIETPFGYVHDDYTCLKNFAKKLGTDQLEL